ncbi:NADPH-dependent FMN reductase family protein [Actinacidiphila oryziradicis]|uniref:hypothetical protein n=1 Tax=Actinacidiphila oryziradicis TaxID=2571141 RepID=UPI001B809EF3|nr:hypothetical protein [Actinacidiphila oryziradicis]
MHEPASARCRSGRGFLPNRAGAAVAESFAEAARAHEGFEVDVADLAEIDLPLFNEPNHPMTGNYVHE